MEQINVKTTELPKLTISETITERRTVEKEITLPYFFKDEYGNLCKVVSNDYYISTKPDFVYSVEVYPVKSFKGRIASGTTITEDEFDAAFDKSMTYIQMMAQNDDAPVEADDNIQIDQQLYNQY